MSLIKNEQMTDVAKGELLLNLTADQIERVYSGRPGCGCGCLGNYSGTKSAKTRILNILRNQAPLGEIDVHPGGEGGGVIAWETETRYRWIYLKAKEA